MKLFLFGLYKDEEPQQSFRDALRGISDEYREFSFVHNIPNARKDFHSIMAEFKPDVVFMQVQSPGIIKASTLVRYPDVKFFNFSGDVREVFPAWYYEVAPYCTTLFTNKDWVWLMEKRGFKARYFQVGFDHNIYTPTGHKAETPPVVFMGNNHGNSFAFSRLRGEMVERFSSKPWFQAYGRGWKNGIDLNYKQQQEAAIYRGAKIGINLSHIDLDCYTSDRMFRLMGSGCMCLAYEHKNIRDEFENGIHLSLWSTLDELEHEINKWLAIPDIRETIADNGCNLVHHKYSWPARIYHDLLPLL